VLRSEAVFKVGDLVLVKLHLLSSKILQRSVKVANKWSSPLVIAMFLTKVRVQLANPDTGVVVKKAHVLQLEKYFVA
jgi:Tfp pilus assembly protein PilZ